MSVLLRQPSGFEGILPILVETEALDSAIADRTHPGSASLDFDPVAPLRVPGVPRYHEITGFDYLVYLEANGFPHPEELVQEGAYLIKFEDTAHRADCPREVQLGVRTQVLERGLQVLPVESVDKGPHDLHVLLRHRPRSIPQTRELLQ